MKGALTVALLVMCGSAGLATAASARTTLPPSWSATWPTFPPWWPTNWPTPWPTNPTTTPAEVTTTTDEPTTTEEPCVEYKKYPCPFNCGKFFVCVGGQLYLMDCNARLEFNAAIEECDLPERANCVASTTAPPTTTSTEAELTTTTAAEPEPETTGTADVTTTAEPVTTTAEQETTTTEEPVTTTTAEEPATTATTTETVTVTTTPATTTRTTPTPPTPPAGVCPPGSGHVYIAHPSDCTRFFQCNHGIAHEHTCPAPLHFDPKAFVCNWPNLAGCTAA